MEMLRSEVKLLLLRNSQLENENLLLKQNESKLSQNMFKEKRLNKVLENIKLAQNEYISKLNLLLIEITEENGSQNYNQIKNEINSCVKTCKQLQHEYEMCKQLVSNRKSFDSTQDSQQSIDTNIDQSDNEDMNEEELLSIEQQELEDEEEEEEEEDQQMPKLDLIEPQMSDSETDNIGVDVEDDDDDPNGAGEQYLDMNDKEFVPKGNVTIPKNARKSFSFSDNRLQTTPKKKKSKDREFKTSQKFGDKFRCNWKDCVFISSYKQNVERHYRVHTGERPFKCHFKGCGFSASQAGNLKVHQQRHGHQSSNAHKIRIKSTHNAIKLSPKKDQK